MRRLTIRFMPLGGSSSGTQNDSEMHVSHGDSSWPTKRFLKIFQKSEIQSRQEVFMYNHGYSMQFILKHKN